MKKTLLILLFLLVGVSYANAQEKFKGVQYLPHIVAGTLQDSAWDTVIEPKCLSSLPCPMTIEFFNSIGAPLVLDTDQGMSNRFELIVPPAVPGPGSFVIQVRRAQKFVDGWARVTSPSTFSGIAKFRQFLPGGADPVGVANVFFTPSDIVLTYDLKPSNGVALVNPGTADATVTVTALFGGVEEKRTFTLLKGGHIASFFNEPPFLFFGLLGNVVISSNVPLAGMELGFEGLEFFTLPSLPTIRRLDAKRANIKIGAVYVYSSEWGPQPNIAKRFDEGFSQFESLLRHELALNGTMSNIPELPIDRDENGQPKVLILKLSKPRIEYLVGKEKNGDADLNVIAREIRQNVPSDWTFQVVYVDIWKINEGGFVPQMGGGGGFGGTAWLPAFHLPFLKEALFGNKGFVKGVPIEELGGQPFPFASSTTTWDSAAEHSFQVFSHEVGHALGLTIHVGPDPLVKDAKPWRTIMGYEVHGGCYSKLADNQCILSPVEAHLFARMPIMNLHDYGWAEEDSCCDKGPFKPEAEVISKELVGHKAKVTLRVHDFGSGVHSVWLESAMVPHTFYWKLLGHDDDINNIVIEAKLPPDFTEGRFETVVWLGVMDYHGNITITQIF